MTSSKYGFTLIELLIVIAILAILSTLGIGNFTSSRIKARDLSRKSDLQTIAKSLEAYANDHRTYPTSDSNFKIKCKTDGSICDWGTPFADGANASTTTTVYATKLPSDPTGYTYHYVSQNGSNYTIYAFLENTNDPSVNQTGYTGITCGSKTCNYKITSSNL
jgi:prepilin-type N-terminal cleavage/methylation domain-containing protein